MDTPVSLALSRAVARVCEQPMNNMYTQHELDQCIVDVFTSVVGVTNQSLSDTYGPSKRTIVHVKKLVVEFVGAAQLPDLAKDAEGVRKAMASLRAQGHLKKMGSNPLMRRPTFLAWLSLRHPLRRACTKP